MEFLVTYSWALLILVLAIAALAYFGILDLSRFTPRSCTFPVGTLCVDMPVIDAANDQITIALRNNVGSVINVTDYLNVSEGCSIPASLLHINNLAPPQLIENNNIIKLTIDCPGLEQGRSRTEIIFSYVNQNTGITHIVKGYITGVAS